MSRFKALIVRLFYVVQRVRRLEEQVKSQLDLESAANDGADDMDDFDDMPDDTAESAPKRKHLVFTDAEDAGASRVPLARVWRLVLRASCGAHREISGG